MYLLFIHYASGLCHNAVYDDLITALDSIHQLFEEENQEENILSIEHLKQHLKENDDFKYHLENTTWFHLQPHPIFA